MARTSVALWPRRAHQSRSCAPLRQSCSGVSCRKLPSPESCHPVRGDSPPRECQTHVAERAGLCLSARALHRCHFQHLWQDERAKHHLRSSAGACAPGAFLPFAVVLTLTRPRAAGAAQNNKIMPNGVQQLDVHEELAAALHHAPTQLVEKYFGADVAAGHTAIPAVRRMLASDVRALTRVSQEERRTRRAADFIVAALWPPSAPDSCLSSDLFTPHEEALLEDARLPSSDLPASRHSPDLFTPCDEASLEAPGSCLPLQAVLEHPDDPFASLFTAAFVSPQKMAVVCESAVQPLMYAQLYARAQALAGAFMRLGLKQRGRVAVMLANSVAVLDVHHAAAATRAVVVNLNTHLAAPELAFMICSAAPEMLVLDAALAPLLTLTLSASVWGPVGAASCSLRTVLWVGGCPESSSLECLSTLGVSSFAFEGLVSNTSASLSLRDLPARSPVDAYMIFFTSGTTGRPKMVQLSHRVVATHARGTVREMRLHASDVWLHAAPMFHLVDAFSIYAITLVGGTHVILRSFAAAEALRCLERERVTVTNMASTMALLCVNNPAAAFADLSSLRTLSCGGSPLPAAAVRRALSVFGTEFCMSYGMTECWCAPRLLLKAAPLTSCAPPTAARFR